MGWWIIESERVLTEQVPAAPDEVRSLYVDLNNIKAVHPLVVSVRETSRRDTADGYLQSYRVADRIPLGRIAIRISYRVQLQVPVHGDVITEARQFPLVRLQGRVSFQPADDGTCVFERLRIAAPRGLIAITTRQAVEAHIAMLAGIRRCFQSPQ